MQLITSWTLHPKHIMYYQSANWIQIKTIHSSPQNEVAQELFSIEQEWEIYRFLLISQKRNMNIR